MYTLVDFITHVKGIEYVLCVSAIAGFLLFWEILKPAPFKTVAETGKEDLTHIGQSGGIRHVMKNVGKIAAAPFIGLAYIVMLPVGFFAALAVAAANMAMKAAAGLAGKSATFEWRPMEAYLAGKRKKQKKVETVKEEAE